MTEEDLKYKSLEAAIQDGFLVMPELDNDEENLVLYNNDNHIFGFKDVKYNDKLREIYNLVYRFINTSTLSLSYFNRIVHHYLRMKRFIKTREQAEYIIPYIILNKFDKFEIASLFLQFEFSNLPYYFCTNLTIRKSVEYFPVTLDFNLLRLFNFVFCELITSGRTEDAKFIFNKVSITTMKALVDRDGFRGDLKTIARFYEDDLDITKAKKTFVKNSSFKKLIPYFKKETVIDLLKTDRAYANYVLPKFKFTEAELIDLIKTAKAFKSNTKIMGAQPMKENSCGYILKTQTVTPAILNAILEGPYANDKEDFLQYMTRRKKTLKNVECLDEYILDIVNAGCNLKFIDADKQLQEDSSKLIIEVGGAD